MYIYFNKDLLFTYFSRIINPTCRTRISQGLMINACVHFASSRRLIFGGPVIALWLALKSLSIVKLELMQPNRS